MGKNLRFDKKLQFSLLVCLASVMGAYNVNAMIDNEDSSNSSAFPPLRVDPNRPKARKRKF